MRHTELNDHRIQGVVGEVGARIAGGYLGLKCVLMGMLWQMNVAVCSFGRRTFLWFWWIRFRNDGSSKERFPRLSIRLSRGFRAMLLFWGLDGVGTPLIPLWYACDDYEVFHESLNGHSLLQLGFHRLLSSQQWMIGSSRVSVCAGRGFLRRPCGRCRRSYCYGCHDQIQQVSGIARRPLYPRLHK